MTKAVPAACVSRKAALGPVAFAWACHLFVVAALIGVLLRTTLDWPGFVREVVNWRHAHSHVAFLGWVFNGLFAFAVADFVVPEDQSFYRRLFWPLQAGVVGALVAFPLQGYGPVSIAFSSVHTFVTVIFIWRLLRRNLAGAAAKPFLHGAVMFLLLSALGPLALGPLAAAGLRATPWYLSAVTFYLHFQYNGWFVFFLLAVFWQGTTLAPVTARRAAGLLALGTFLTYSQSLLWLGVGGALTFCGAAGALLQLAGLALLLRPGLAAWRERRERPRSANRLLALAGAGLVAKGVLQGLAVVPSLSGWVSDRSAIIGFLHLVFLGVVTPALLGFARERGWLTGAGFRWGATLFVAGAVGTGGLLGLQAFRMVEPLYAERGLFVAGGVMVVGCASLLPALRFPTSETSVSRKTQMS